MNHAEDRRDLAAALRWTARENLHEGIANHYSLAVSEDGAQFLLNPYGKHWSKMCASDLLKLDANAEPSDIGGTVDPTAWAIHGAIHKAVPHARCIMHSHSKYAAALSSLKNPVMPPIDQNTMRFFNRYTIDAEFNGMGLGDEAERLATLLGDQSILLMGNHGVLVAAENTALAFDTLFYFERAAQTYITALQTGEALNIVSDAVAEKTARQWEAYEEYAGKHLSAIREVLDTEEPDYRL